MRTFSIAEVEQFTKIKAHTLRTWEQRFEIFKSQRKANGVRIYTLEELSYLLDFALLNRLGSKVSVLAKLDKQSIREKVLQLQDDSCRQEFAINQLIIQAYTLNIEDFELLLDGAVAAWGIEQTIEQIIFPFLERLDLFSYNRRTSGDYHFVVTALRKKIILAIEGAKPQKLLAKSALLFLPKDEHFDLFLLYMNYKLRTAGLNVLYLGTNVSADNLKVILQAKQPQFLLTYQSTLSSRYKPDFEAYLKAIGYEARLFVGTPPSLLVKASLLRLKYILYHQVDTELLAC
jgi:DNA-binding transcriptional MerR regulator